MLCIFADTSEDALGACAYARQRKDNNTSGLEINFFVREPAGD